MRSKQLFPRCVAILFVAGSAWAGAIQDPAAGVIDDNFSSPISTFTSFDPHLLPGGMLGLYNDTGYPIISLSLHTIINTGLTAADINSSFTCNSGPANPFFLNCGFTYVSSTGSLTIRFFGINSPDNDEDGGYDTESGEQEGIPTFNPGCLPTPDAPGCNQVGHFAFVFNNGFLTSGADLVNGWVAGTTSTANPTTLLFRGQPVFDAPGFSTTASPEPSSILLLGGGMFLLAGLARRR